MPKGALSVTGLAAFGAGVAVGANWPRASNLVVYLLKRLGVELTDLAFWIWEPEQGAVLSQEASAPARPQRRPRARPIQDGNPTKDKPRAQATKAAHSPSAHPGGKAGRVKSDFVYARCAQPTKGIPPNGRKATNPSLTRPDGTATRTSPAQLKRAAIKGEGKPPSARTGRKTRTFPAAVSPAAAALN